MRRALIVDDSATARSALRAIVEGFGLAVDEAEDGTVALQRLQVGRFDLVFVDVHMPVLDGPSLIRILRGRWIDVRVVLITTGAPTSMIAAAVKLGVSDYVRKPFDPEQVRLAVARALEIAPVSLAPETVRVLLCTRADDVSDTLRALLPPHVAVDAVEPEAAAAARRTAGYPVILLDASVDAGAETRIRAAAPRAMVFGMRDGSPAERWWSPEATRDGTLPRALDGAVVDGFLFASFLRPLVFADGSVFTATGFDGNPRHAPAWFVALERALVRRAAEADPTTDLVMDLRRVPPDAAAIARLARGVHAALEAAGPVPAFRVTPAVRAQLAGDPALRQLIVFSD